MFLMKKKTSISESVQQKKKLLNRFKQHYNESVILAILK